MAVQHNTLTGLDLHEPKGIATAPSGSVYRSSGGGSGAWGYITETLSFPPCSFESTSDYTLLPMAQNCRMTYAVFTISNAFTVISGDVASAVLRDSAGNILAQANFTASTSAKGDTVSIPLNINVLRDSYLELGVVAQTSSPALVHCTISMEVL